MNYSEFFYPYKVSDWNSFRVNQNYFDSFWYMYPSQCESYRTNPKNVLYLVWWKTIKNQPDLTRLILKNQSEWIRTNANPVLGLMWIDLNWKLGFGLVRIHSDWFLEINRINPDCFLIVFHQTRYKTFFGLVRNDSHWLGYRYRNESE